MSGSDLRLTVDFPTAARIEIPGGHNPAIPLRRNDGEAAETVWRSDAPAPIVAAFATMPMGDENLDRIVVRVRCEGARSATVRALADPGHAFGPVAPVEATEGGTLVLLGEARVGAIGTGIREFAWRWQVEEAGAWRDLGEQRIRLYAVPRPPEEPWLGIGNEPPIATPYHVWTDVLDWSCRWAEGARTPQEAAGLVVRAIHDRGRPDASGRLTYDDGGKKYGTVGELDAALNELTPDAFFVRDFLARLAGLEGRGGGVNCFDCAGAVTIFGAALGCPLRKVSLSLPDKGRFRLHPMRLLGGASVDDPEVADFFHEHVVAWAGPLDETGTVYDASTAIANADGTFAPAEGIAWGRSDDPGGYRARLTPHGAELRLDREYRPLLLVTPRLQWGLAEG